MTNSKIMPSIEEVKHLQIPLQEISLATNRFANKNLIANGGFGKVYKGVSKKHGDIAIKRLEHGQGQGDHEFKTEISLLSKCKHENIVSLLGFCDEEDEKILVYKYESNGSLDKHLNNKDLTWTQLLKICLDVARGLNHVHDNDGSQLRIFHRDIKSSNILLDWKWKAMISDFGLSRVIPANGQSSFVISNPCGTPGYIDPDYYMNGYLTEKTDVYSFGVVLWEVLCGRHALVTSYTDERRFLTRFAQKHYTKGTLYSIIPSDLQKQISPASLHMFSDIAYQCLKNVEDRPTIKQVMEQLENALVYQMNSLMPVSIEEVKHFQIPLQEILLATNEFDSKNLYSWVPFGHVYKGISGKHRHNILVFRLSRKNSDYEFKMTVSLILERRHGNGNIGSLLGFCDEDGEKLLVYKDERDQSLEKILDNENLTVDHRLLICLDVARARKDFPIDFYQVRDLDFNSSTIILDANWKARISDIGWSMKLVAKMQSTSGYNDPGYFTSSDLAQKSDVYSLGVIMWEVLCGRRLTSEIDLIQEHYKNQTLDRIIPSYLFKQLNKDSLITFSNIAYQCLNNGEERPSLREIEEQLQKALDQQLLSGCSAHQDLSTELDFKLNPTSSLPKDG